MCSCLYFINKHRAVQACVCTKANVECTREFCVYEIKYENLIRDFAIFVLCAVFQA